MSLSIYNSKIIVYDHSNMGILCEAPSDEIASALVLGLVNGDWQSISRGPDNKIPSNYDYLSLDKHYQVSISNLNPSGRSVISMDKRLITDAWIEKRKLIFEKRQALISYEWICRFYTSRVSNFYGWSNMLPFLLEELNKCDVDNNIFSDAIIEYANIQEINPEAAYYDLRRKSDDIGFSYLRTYAVYEKMSKLISLSSTKEEVWNNFNKASRIRKGL